MKFDLDIKGFTKDLIAIGRESTKTKKQVLFENGGLAVQEIVDATPEDNGFARAGFTEPWKELGLSGTPMSGSDWKALGHLSHLSSLVLWSSKPAITDADLKEIQQGK